MANPNIVNTTAIYGKTVAINPSTTSPTLLVNNPANSNVVLKVNYIIVANVNATQNSAATVSYYTATSIGGTAFPVASTIAVPADASLIILDKPIYIEENRSLGVTSLTANDLSFVCSYEEIS